MQVLHVCSEMFPLLKTGGLADVIGALPAAQIADGVDARVLLPAFPDIRRGVTDAQVVSRRDTFAGHITLFSLCTTAHHVPDVIRRLAIKLTKVLRSKSVTSSNPSTLIAAEPP